MHASVRALLNQVIDYAGLFPPAKLPLDTALASYLRYRRESPYAWMLGRFVCPAARLPELLTLAKGDRDASLLTLTVLGQQGSSVLDYFEKLNADIEAVKAFRSAWGNDAVIDMIETPLPTAENVEGLPTTTTWEAFYFGYANAMAYYLHFVAAKVREAGLRGFAEVPVSPRWREDVSNITVGFPAGHDLAEASHIGLKLRCGGVTADAFPADEQVAWFIDCCTRSRLAWKATAGLHHPRRHWDANLQVWHHGFLNVFIVGLLARINPMGVGDITQVLADREGECFHWRDDSIAWKDWSITTQQIVELRATAATSFGSCSFTEPVDDLLAMGLLDGQQVY
jgi:hypothetical protein